MAGDPDEVWALLSDYGSVVRCLPGARLGDLRADGRYDASISVRFGVVPLEFSGSAAIAADSERRTLTVHAQGSDRARSTKALADVGVSVAPDPATAGAALEVRGTFEFAGPLARIAETGGKGVVDSMMRTFTESLARTLAGGPSAAGTEGAR